VVGVDIEELTLKWYDQIYAFCDSHGIVRLAYKLIKQQPMDKPACEKSIICNEAQGCDRRSCPARTVTINYYIRRLKGI